LLHHRLSFRIKTGKLALDYYNKVSHRLFRACTMSSGTTFSDTCVRALSGSGRAIGGVLSPVKVESFRKAWYSSCVRCGLGKMEQATDDAESCSMPGHAAALEAESKNGLSGNDFHDLRRTGVRNLVRAGVPEKVAMSIADTKHAASLTGTTSAPAKTFRSRQETGTVP